MNQDKQKQKLKGLLGGLNETRPEPIAERSEPKLTKRTPKKETRTEANPPAQGAAAAQGRGVGRPPGKRSDPEYQSVTTFLHKQTYLDVQRALIGSDQDFGDVVDDLLKDWLKRNA